MDECGVDFAVILAELAPITTGIADNESVARILFQVPASFPLRASTLILQQAPAQELERWVIDHGFRGDDKLYPTYQQFYPNDSRIYPLYAKAQELGIPVMLHVGSSVFTGSRLKYGDPLYLDDVAVDFPELSLIQSHSGASLLVWKGFHPGPPASKCLYGGGGAPPSKLLTYFPELERLADKVIFGSDGWATDGEGKYPRPSSVCRW